MEIDWLEDFLALSSAGVFNRAADARNVSHSAFTRRIKNLEYWVGASLFDRSVHPVILTPAGQAFKQTAEETVKSLELARGEARGLARKESEVLEFVALHTLAISFFPAWVSTVSRAVGGFPARVEAENFSACVEAVLAGKSDFMLCYSHPSVPTISEDDRHPSITIKKDRLICVSAVDEEGLPIYSWDSPDKLPFLSYSAESFLGRLTNHCIERAGIGENLKKIYENSVAEALKAACLEGMGIAWLPALSIGEEIESGKLVQIGDKSSESMMSIKLYRSIERSRSEVERLWTFAKSQVVS